MVVLNKCHHLKFIKLCKILINNYMKEKILLKDLFLFMV